MGYITGICNSYNELKSAFVDLCVTAGWGQTTDSNGKTVVYKGSDGLYIMVEVGALTSAPSTPDCLRILGRTSVNGGDAPTKVGISNFYSSGPGPVTFPVTFHGFYYSNVNEVYFVIEYNQMYQFIAFGKSTVLLPGTGLWVAGSVSPHDDTNSGTDLYRSRPYAIYMTTSGFGYGGTFSDVAPALFWVGVRRDSSSPGPFSDRNYWVHSNLDASYPWSLSSGDYKGNRVGVAYLSLYFQAQPQQFNKEAFLMPVLAYKPSNLYSGYYHLVASLINARHMKINYIDPETVITKDGEQWVVFPCFKKMYQNEYWTTAETGSTHSGNFGWAVKKEA